MDNTALGRLLSWWGASRLVRVLALSLLVLLLLVPIAVISDLVREREMTRDEALAEVGQKWGGAQRVAGPWLIIPYVRHIERRLEDGTVERRKVTHHLRLLPEELKVRGEVDTQVRHRGIYEVPLYRSALVVEGEFASPDLSTWDIAEQDVLWRRAHLAVAVSDGRAIDSETSLTSPCAPLEGRQRWRRYSRPCTDTSTSCWSRRTMPC
ncbi:MAG: inner membrane CreD family protein [Myxococcales bacterium]|nr:inner membrane CreD family protein [Myxococcales bacterium]